MHSLMCSFKNMIVFRKISSKKICFCSWKFMPLMDTLTTIADNFFLFLSVFKESHIDLIMMLLE